MGFLIIALCTIFHMKLNQFPAQSERALFKKEFALTSELILLFKLLFYHVSQFQIPFFIRKLGKLTGAQPQHPIVLQYYKLGLSLQPSITNHSLKDLIFFCVLARWLLKHSSAFLEVCERMSCKKSIKIVYICKYGPLILMLCIRYFTGILYQHLLNCDLTHQSNYKTGKNGHFKKINQTQTPNF